MYALVDCNNFYVSCERLFQPGLKGKAVVVLSNNDGCVIARSEEAKALGIVMGTPAHLHQRMFAQHDVRVFSSNYTLYGDISERVMITLASFVNTLELYSIDEAFLDMTELDPMQLAATGSSIRNTVAKHIGIPVSVGIAQTKTLAKMANRFAKKHYPQVGVYCSYGKEELVTMLKNTKVEDIWGIGKKYAVLLRQHGFTTAEEVTRAPADWMRAHLSVVGLRLWKELNGTPAIAWEEEGKIKKNICTSRSFGSLTDEISIIREAVSNHAASCARKLRQQSSVCRAVKIFIATNPHKTSLQQYSHSISINCAVPTNLTNEVIGYALKGLDMIYKPGKYLYMKCGVEVLDIVGDDAIQANIFSQAAAPKKAVISKVIDTLNDDMGKDTIKMAVQRFDKRYRLRAAYLSQKYTTDVKQILHVKI